MFVYEEAWNYEGYLNSDLLEYKVKQEKIFDKIKLSLDTENKLKLIKTTVNIVIFGEIYCPDCRAVVPFLEKFARVNPNININIFPREGNKAYMSKHSKVSYIPLVLIEDISKKEGEFINILEGSLPRIMKMLENLDPKEREETIYKFRIGKNNEELENYLIDKILEISL